MKKFNPIKAIKSLIKNRGIKISRRIAIGKKQDPGRWKLLAIETEWSEEEGQPFGRWMLINYEKETQFELYTKMFKSEAQKQCDQMNNAKP